MTRDLTVTDFTAFIKDNTGVSSPSIIPEIKLHLATEMTKLWSASEKMFEASSVPAPFWSFAWPGGQAIARFILDHPEWVKGKRVFDFASGSGLMGFAALKAGAAHVVANDVDPVAITAIGLNAVLNDCTLATEPANMIGKDLTGFDLLIVGDFCYEWPVAGYALEWIRSCAAKGITVLLADPGRPHAPKTGITEIARYIVPTSLEVEDAPEKTAVIYRVLADE